MYHFIIFDLLVVLIFFYNIEAKQVAENIIVRAGKQIAGGKPRVDLLKEKSRQRSRKIRDHDIVNGEDEMCPVYVTKIIDLEWVYIGNPKSSPIQSVYFPFLTCQLKPNAGYVSSHS